MRISEFLITIASWLESPENEALLLAEYDENCLKLTADACISAADLLRSKASEIEKIEPAEEPKLNSEALDHLNNILTAFDTSEDQDLKKISSTIDEILVVMAEKMSEIRSLKYNDIKSKIDEINKVKETAQAIDKSPFYQETKLAEAPLSTRYCPDHHGTNVARVGEDTWQCPLDKKIYNFQTGFVMEDGEKVPGGSVAEQTKDYHSNPKSMFDSRQERLSK